MSTQISCMLEDSYEIFHRIFHLLDEPHFQPSLIHSQEKSGSRQIDRTFQESVMKSRHPKVNEIASRLQKCLAQHLKNENEHFQKYEEQLQFLQAKLRKQTKNEIQNRLLIETLEEENTELRRQILNLKDDLIDNQKFLEGAELRMKTQIKTLQSEIYSLKKLDNLISDNRCGFETPEQRNKTLNQISKKKNTISQIKNRLSFCDINDFHVNFFDTLTPNTIKDINKTADHGHKNFLKKEKNNPLNSASRRSSHSSMSRKYTSKQAQIKESQKIVNDKVKKSRKDLKLQQLQPKISVAQNMSGSKSSSKLKIKK